MEATGQKFSRKIFLATDKKLKKETKFRGKKSKNFRAKSKENQN